MVRRLLRAGHECVVYDREPGRGRGAGRARAPTGQRVARRVRRQADAAARRLGHGAGRRADRGDGRRPRASGSTPGDAIIDGGNSYFKDDVRRAPGRCAAGASTTSTSAPAAASGALERGYCLMVGGDKRTPSSASSRSSARSPRAAATIDRARPGRDRPRRHGRGGLPALRPAGAGHFVKMIHNGIEYGLMQAYAEGFDILHNAARRSCPTSYRYDLDLRRHRRALAARQRGRLLAARPDRIGARRGPATSTSYSGVRAGLRRGPLDGAGGDRGGGAGRRARRRRSSPASARGRSTPSPRRCSRRCASSSAATSSAPRSDAASDATNPTLESRREPRSRRARASIVIFGASGDLTKRKLVPPLYNLRQQRAAAAASFAVVGVARGRLQTTQGSRASCAGELPSFATATLDAERLERGSRERLYYRARRLRRSRDLRALCERARRASTQRARHGAATYSSTSRRRPTSSRRSSSSLGAAGLTARSRRPLAARGRREAVRPRSRVGAGAQPRRSARCSASDRSTASTTTSARRRSRTSSSSASPTASSSRSGTATTSTTCRSRSPRRSASSSAAATTTRPARCATWCRTTCSSSSR